jgi:hypothetical protein
VSGAATLPSSPDGPWPSGPASFRTTRSSRILAAGDGDPATSQAREALAELCRAYWYPLYAFICRRGHDPETSRDLTREFFTRLIEADFLRLLARHHRTQARLAWILARSGPLVVASGAAPPEARREVLSDVGNLKTPGGAGFRQRR